MDKSKIGWRDNYYVDKLNSYSHKTYGLIAVGLGEIVNKFGNPDVNLHSNILSLIKAYINVIKNK